MECLLVQITPSLDSVGEVPSLQTEGRGAVTVSFQLWGLPQVLDSIRLVRVHSQVALVWVREGVCLAGETFMAQTMTSLCLRGQ